MTLTDYPFFRDPIKNYQIHSNCVPKNGDYRKTTDMNDGGGDIANVGCNFYTQIANFWPVSTDSLSLQTSLK